MPPLNQKTDTGEDRHQLEARCRRQWEANESGVRDKYKSLEAYVAAEWAFGRGSARVLGESR